MERTAPDGAAPPWAPCTRSQLPPQSLDRHSPSAAPAKMVSVVITGAAGAWANANAAAPAASSRPPSATAASRPFIDPPPFTGPLQSPRRGRGTLLPALLRLSSGEVGTEAGGGLFRVLGGDPPAAHHAHEVGVAGPPRPPV